MRRVLGILALFLVLLAAQPAYAGGAWPRGKGRVFASVTWSSFGDLLGYLQALQKPVETKPKLETTDEIGIYAEYGLTPRLTFGLDRYHQPSTDVGANIWFLRRSFGNPGWENKYAAEIGYGQIRDWRGVDDDLLRLGLSWGRSFDSRWGGGWIDVDAKAGRFLDSGSTLWKVDSTLGLKPSDKNLWALQLQTGGVDGNPNYLKGVPFYVRRLGYGISLESGLLIGLKNDESLGMKLGAWVDF